VELYYNWMAYQVRIKKKVVHGLGKLPVNVRRLLFLLVADLQEDGPIQRGWPSFSALSGDRFHCHLIYRYVACWTYKKGEIVIEVYYVGSREKAPY
jgi:mRNA-degrading endonuclease RelE of RelBE toxin-antitoxin system